MKTQADITSGRREFLTMAHDSFSTIGECFAHVHTDFSSSQAKSNELEWTQEQRNHFASWVL